MCYINFAYTSIPTGELVAGVDKGAAFAATRKVSPPVFLAGDPFLESFFQEKEISVVK